MLFVLTIITAILSSLQKGAIPVIPAQAGIQMIDISKKNAGLAKRRYFVVAKAPLLCGPDQTE